MSQLCLNSLIDFVGKWEIEPSAIIPVTFISFSAEFSLAKVTLETLNQDNVAHQLKDDVEKLPDTYDSTTCDKFHEFFETWGSHYVREVKLGGYILITFRVNATKLDSIDCKDLEYYILDKFLSYGTSFTNKHNYYQAVPHPLNLKLDVMECQVNFVGGNPPLVTNLEELKSGDFQRWFHSLSNHPVDLEQTIKLGTYYNLCSSEVKRAALRRATIEYMNSNLFKMVSITRSSAARSGIREATSTKKKPFFSIIAEELKDFIKKLSDTCKIN